MEGPAQHCGRNEILVSSWAALPGSIREASVMPQECYSAHQATVAWGQTWANVSVPTVLMVRCQDAVCFHAHAVEATKLWVWLCLSCSDAVCCSRAELSQRVVGTI